MKATTDETLNIQIQNRLVEQLTVRNRELKLVNSFTRYLQNCNNTHEIMSLLAKNFKAYFAYDYCEIYLVDHNKEFLNKVELGDIDNDNHESNGHKLIAFGQGLVGKVAHLGFPKIASITDIEEVDVELPVNYGSEIAIPLVHNGRDVVGVMYSKHKDPDFFELVQLKTIITMASIAADKVLQTYNLDKINDYQTQLEEYVHIVSHDLKSPLRSINALITWIKEDNQDKLTGETLRNFELIDTTLLQMDNLITNTLNYSRMDYDVFEEEEVDLSLLIKEIQKTIQLSTLITFKMPHKLPIVKGNKTKFMQIFQNLIENAVKYIDKPKGEITIDFSSNSDFYKFSVKDNGVGIKEMYYEKIFQVFQTLNDTKGSSGVGLSIVKKLVNNYGGKIWLKSREGVGTTFFFTLKR
ncbi:GAF domain-containing sensor histidine kinase [Mariniflexile sp. AS56]|uniref:GAF domain-containing sensor histidine kinase n=1 Tax=Mariniflexile sp. AS56 TaxID=3063957 RepID=UPI0026ED71F7|nr:GAF domain-containing sensor histidine kinase [Mariniflexile sp. AS56]MDO7173676.1 GAF domain-containing sensor histidine kinase [Mariniflexile sp. AS56]